MKKLIKILPILMIIMLALTTVSPVFAAVGDTPSGGSASSASSDSMTFGGKTIKPNDNPTGKNSILTTGNSILGVIRLVGTIIAVGIIMVLGIKYMMGSAEEKAEYKKTFIPYIVGAVLLFAGVNIAAAVVELANGIGG